MRKNYLGKVAVCLRCQDHTEGPKKWVVRIEKRPEQCPRCHSPLWDRPKEEKK